MRFLRFFSSLKLAVIVILLVAGASIAGTILESKFDAMTARFWVYQARWFYGVMVLLAVNLASVMVHRWPWRVHHMPFLLAHIGILSMLLGSWITDRKGLDGILRIAEGETQSHVELSSFQLVISDTTAEQPLWVVPIEWTPPHARFRPIAVDKWNLQVTEWIAHTDLEPKFTESVEPGAAPAVKVRISGGPMAIRQEFWLWGGDPNWNVIQAGPARLMVFRDKIEIPEGLAPSESWIAFAPDADKKGLVFKAYSGMAKQHRSGGLKSFVPSSPARLDLGWKAQVEVLEWMPHATAQMSYKPSRVQYGQAAPSPAIRLMLKGAVDGVWLGLGERATLMHQGRELQVGFYPKQVSLPFGIRLDRFEIERYPGGMSPKSYASMVTVMGGSAGPLPAGASARIEMNEPLKVKGLTFYQASYEEAQPRPTVTILSVNRDPGRWFKYIGAIVLVLGILWLFSTKWSKRGGHAV